MCVCGERKVAPSALYGRVGGTPTASPQPGPGRARGVCRASGGGRMAAVAVACAVRRARARERARRHGSLSSGPLWHGSPLVSSPAAEVTDEFDSAAMPALPLFEASISKEAYELLRSCSTHTYDASEEAMCSICLCTFGSGETVKSPSCGHCFHGRCLRAWFQASHSTCPVCRESCCAADASQPGCTPATQVHSGTSVLTGNPLSDH